MTRKMSFFLLSYYPILCKKNESAGYFKMVGLKLVGCVWNTVAYLL